MAIDIEKPSEVAQIPAAPGIKLENLVQFDGDCIDPLALVIITEALDYALETSVRRLRSAGKIFSGVEESAYGIARRGVLPTIKAVRDALLEAPQCTPTGPRVMPPPASPEEAIMAETERRTAKLIEKPKKKLTEIEAMIETLPEEVRATVRKEYAALQKKAEPLEAVKPKPKAVQRALAAKEEPPKKEAGEEAERTLPGLWGPAFFEGKEYESPQVLAKELGIKTRGAKDMVVAFQRAGFEVRGDGPEVEKGKTGFIVKRVLPKIPVKYRLEREEAEYPGAAVLEPMRKGVPREMPVEELKEEWITIRNVKKEIIGWDPIDKKTGLRVPERRVWKGSKEAKEMGFEK